MVNFICGVAATILKAQLMLMMMMMVTPEKNKEKDHVLIRPPVACGKSQLLQETEKKRRKIKWDMTPLPACSWMSWVCYSSQPKVHPCEFANIFIYIYQCSFIVATTDWVKMSEWRPTYLCMYEYMRKYGPTRVGFGDKLTEDLTRAFFVLFAYLATKSMGRMCEQINREGYTGKRLQ